MNTKISYLYRDADNYKKVNECVIAGTLTTEQICTIKDCCDMGEYFIPRQVGLLERRFDDYDSEIDHCWFELNEDSFSETTEPPTIALTGTHEAIISDEMFKAVQEEKQKRSNIPENKFAIGMTF